jgi:hypothetical protein
MTPNFIMSVSGLLESILFGKAGWKTSEFWLTVAANLIGVGLQVGASFPSDSRVQISMLALGTGAQVLSTMGYQAKRAAVKIAPNDAPTLDVAKQLATALQQNGPIAQPTPLTAAVSLSSPGPRM